jgi:ABC-type branched-subunit amino acid transport system substrate-binding protein
MLIIRKLQFSFCFFFFFFSFSGYCQQDITVRIGVMSPQQGSQRATGEAHDFWVKLALTPNGKIVNEQRVIRIEAVFRDTRSSESDTHCLEKAKELVEIEKVAMIIGPVSSGCVRSVLSGDLKVPIIATLASATSLTEKRNPWFFRANGYDKIRIENLWKYIDATLNRTRENKWIVAHDTSDYGMGLLSDLTSTISDSIVLTPFKIPEDDRIKVFRESTITEIKAGKSFFNFFVFGTGDKVLKTLHEINQLTLENQIPHQIYTVGSSKNLLKNSPQSLVTIGEMQIEKSQGSKIKPEVSRLIQQATQRHLALHPTTYQAARFIVPEVIRRVLKSQPSIPKIETLRDIIRQELEDNEFESLQPPRRIKFNKGNMSKIFEFPIYQIKPHYTKINSFEQDIGWIEYLNDAADVNFMESPLKVDLVGHQMEGEEISLSLYRDGKHLVKVKKHKILENNKPFSVPFHLYRPGSYHVISNISSYPEKSHYKVSFSPLYFICVLSAFLAVFLKQKMTQISWPYRMELLIEGALVGVAVAFISTYIQYSVLPFTSNDWNLINGVLYGFVGGWFGPLLITSLTSRVLPNNQ